MEPADLIAELFNRMTTKQKNAVPPEKAESIGKLMFDAGYRMVFGRWYKQAEPIQPIFSAMNLDQPSFPEVKR